MTSRMFGGVILGVATVLGASCAAPAPETPRTQTVLTAVGVVEPFPLAVTVIDRAGLVSSVKVVAPDEAAPRVTDVGVSNPTDNLRALDVLWISLPCESRSTVFVEGSAPDVRITVYRGTVSPPECDAMGVPRSIRLTLETDVDAHAVAIVAFRGMPPSTR